MKTFGDLLAKMVQKHQKSITFIDKTQRRFSMSKNVIKPIEKGDFCGARKFIKRVHLDIACPPKHIA